MPRITDFCSCIYVLGCKLSVVILCDSDFGITAVDDITIGITYYYYYMIWILLSQTFLPGTSLEPAVIPTAQASSFTLQYFPYYM